MGVGERGKEEGHMLNMQEKQGKRERGGTLKQQQTTIHPLQKGELNELSINAQGRKCSLKREWRRKVC